MSLAPAKDRATMKLEEWIEDLIVRLWCSWRKVSVTLTCVPNQTSLRYYRADWRVLRMTPRFTYTRDLGSR